MDEIASRDDIECFIFQTHPFPEHFEIYISHSNYAFRSILICIRHTKNVLRYFFDSVVHK